MFARQKWFQGQNHKVIMQDKQIWFIKLSSLSSSLLVSCVKFTNPFVNKMTFPERIHTFLWIVSHDISCLIRKVLHSVQYHDPALKMQLKINTSYIHIYKRKMCHFRTFLFFPKTYNYLYKVYIIYNLILYISFTIFVIVHFIVHFTLK